jgi:hypothetical protein
MRKITSTLEEMNAVLNQFGTSFPELVNLYGPPLPPVKHDSHVNCQLVGEWMNGCNSHVELWHDHLEQCVYGTPVLTQYSNIW